MDNGQAAAITPTLAVVITRPSQLLDAVASGLHTLASEKGISSSLGLTSSFGVRMLHFLVSYRLSLEQSYMQFSWFACILLEKCR